MKTPDTLSIWTVYDHPRDFPVGFVARRWEIASGGPPKPTNETLTSPDLDRLREEMELRGLFRLPRQDGDDPVIVETWL